MAEKQVFYGTGKRKDALAKVWLRLGSGDIVVNGTSAAEYLHRYALTQVILQPFHATDTIGQYDAMVKAQGGGIAGQAGAIRHGIAKALVEANEEFRTVLSREGLLTRDPRVKERKHAGCRKARRAKQFSKR